MASNLDTQAAQLLNQAPDFGTIGRDFLRDLGSAHHDGGVLHQQAHDAAETNVGGLFVGAGSNARESLLRRTGTVFVMSELCGNSGKTTNLRTVARGRDQAYYCAVSVKVTSGCPNAYCPSAVTCTVPGLAGSVNTTAATPDEFVTTVRLDSEPALVVNRIVPPTALPPD